MKRVLLLMIILYASSLASFSQENLIEVLLKAKSMESFEQFSFVADNSSPFDFSFQRKPLEINVSDTIPLAVFNDFVRSYLYPNRPQRMNPKLLYTKGEETIDSIHVTSVGILETWVLENGEVCSPKIFLLGKSEPSNNQIQFILYTDTNFGVFVELYLFDMTSKRVLSYFPLFSGEKSNNESCELFGINYTAAYQTTDIKNGIITQIVNDGFNDPWNRKIVLRTSGYYEIVWQDNPLRPTRVFKALIQDPDGYTNVRVSPNSRSTVLYTIGKDESFLIEETPEAKNWYRVFQYKENYSGWIHKSRVQLFEKIYDGINP
jgi:hypothetical protein